MNNNMFTIAFLVLISVSYSYPAALARVVAGSIAHRHIPTHCSALAGLSVCKRLSTPVIPKASVSSLDPKRLPIFLVRSGSYIQVRRQILPRSMNQTRYVHSSSRDQIIRDMEKDIKDTEEQAARAMARRNHFNNRATYEKDSELNKIAQHCHNEYVLRMKVAAALRRELSKIKDSTIRV